MAVIILPPATVTVVPEELLAPQESPTETTTLTSFKATRYLKCKWDDRRLLSQQLKGTITANGQDLIVVSPQQYPGVPAAAVTQVDIAPFAGPGSESPTIAKWDSAVLTVQYSTNALGNSGLGGGSEAVVSEDLEPWTEFLTLPNRPLAWASGAPLSESESPGLLVRGLTWVYRKHLQQSVPLAALELAGMCNQDLLFSFSLGLSFPAETLLYTPPRMSIDTDIGGNRSISPEYRFNFRPNGWNKFFNTTAGEYQEIYRLIDGDLSTEPFKPYPPGNLAALTA